MDEGFKFEAIYKDDDVLQVRISAWNGAFGGSADVYVEHGQLEKAAELLNGFPNQPADTREIIFGNFDPESAGGAVSMRFYCTDGSGHACVESKIRSRSWRGNSYQYVILLLPIEAAAVDSLIVELRLMDLGKAVAACLEGVPASIQA